MTAPDTIIQLVEPFALHKDHYKSANYSEIQPRRELLDPFFTALGWDEDKEAGYAVGAINDNTVMLVLRVLGQRS